MNLVVLSGNISKVNELKGEGDKAVLVFDLAVKKSYVREGERDAWFHRCVAFGGVATAAAKFFERGMHIWVTGELQETQWDDDNGEKHFQKQVVVKQWEFGERKRREQDDDNPFLA